MYSSATAFEGIAVGHLGKHQHQARREHRAFDLGAAQAQEIGRRRSVRLVDAALVAGIDQRDVRQHGRASGRGDQHGVGPRSNQLRDLPGDRRIGPQELFVRNDLDARLLRLRAEHGVPVVAVGIVEADDPDRLHACLHHVADERFRR